MNYAETLLTKSIKRSSIDEAKLTKKKMSLEDAISFLREIKKETQAAKATHEIMTGAMLFVIGVSIVIDVLMDTMGEVATKEAPGFAILSAAYDKARKDKWKNSNYKKEIALADKGFDAILKKTSNSEMKMAVNVAKKMTSNFIGMAGTMKESQDTRNSIMSAMNQLEKQIKNLLAKLDDTNDWLSRGVNTASPVGGMSRI